MSPPEGLWLDLPTAHLFGGEERLCRRVTAFCRRAGFTARVAVADTPGAAHALARFGRDAITVSASGDTLRDLRPLPIAALRLALDVLGTAK